MTGPDHDPSVSGMGPRGVRRAVIALAAMAVATFGWVSPAAAGGISAEIADRILTVRGTAQGDTVTVRCEGGDVTVNQARPRCCDARRSRARLSPIAINPGASGGAADVEPTT